MMPWGQGEPGSTVSLLQATALGGGYGWELAKVTLSLVVVCVVAVLLLRALRRVTAGKTGPGHHLELLQRCPLSPRQTLWLVRAGSRVLVLGATDHRIDTLAELDPAELDSVDLNQVPSGEQGADSGEPT